MPSGSTRYTLPSKRLETYSAPSRTERERRRIGDVGDEGLARAVGPDDEDRDGRLLAARSAERDVEIAVAIEGRAVDLVDAGGERRADLDVRRLARQLVDADGRLAALETRRHDDDQRGRRRAATDAPADAPTRTCGERRVDGKAVAFERDPAALDRPERADRRQSVRVDVSRGHALHGARRAARQRLVELDVPVEVVAPALGRVPEPERDADRRRLVGTPRMRIRCMPACSGVRPPLRRLQVMQQVTMFSQSFRPPWATGTT